MTADTICAQPGPENEVRPTRLGIKRSPPALVIEYTLSHDIEDKRHVHEVGVDARMVQFKIRDLVNTLQKHPRHEHYVKHVQKDQLKVLLNRLRAVVAAASPSKSPAQAGAACSPLSAASPSIAVQATPPRDCAAQLEGRPSPAQPCDSPMESPGPIRRRGNASRRSRSSHAKLTQTRPSLGNVRASKRRSFAHGDVAAGATAGATKPSAIEPPDVSPQAEESNVHIAPLPAQGFAPGAACNLPEDCQHAQRSGPESVEVDDELNRKWPSDAWATWSRNFAAEAGSGGRDVADLFEAFRTSRGVEGIATSFAELLHACAADSVPEAVPGATAMPLDVIRAAVGKHRRLARVLWERLEAKRAEADYCDHPLSGHNVVVVGSGPVGLRSALEMRMLGAEVVVLEQRESFDRINRLHLWPWCGEDLKRWGAKVLEPPELSFGADADFLHIGIAELQMLLFKACLLYGVQVFFGAEYLGSVPQMSAANASRGWDVCVAAAASGRSRPVPGPPVPSRFHGVSVLIGADGPRGRVASAHDLELQETATLRKEAALGLVANYKNRQTAAEKSRRPFSLARQFYDKLFKECEQQSGIELENVVCYISTQTHYFVMTPTRRSLQRAGVFATDGEVMKTLDQAALARAARAIAAFPWKSGEKPLPVETLDSPVGAASLFDFSRQRRAAKGVRLVEGPSATGEEPAKMLVGLCGDALIEPFWPEGLGVIRGFFGALDLASAARLWAETGDADLAVAHFEGAFRQLKSLAAKTRAQVLKPDTQAYGLDPATRYRSLSSAAGSLARSASTPAFRK